MFPRNQMELETFAKRASEAFLSSNVSLDESIEKLAQANSLSTEQIKRVCEIANHQVNEVLLKKSATRNFSFPLANAEGVIGKLRGQDNVVDSSGQDYFQAPKVATRCLLENQVCLSLKHTDDSPQRKEAALRETTSRLQGLFNDAKHLKLAAVRKVAALKDDIYDIVGRMIDSGYKLEDVYQAAKTASPKKELVRDVFTFIADKMQKAGKLDRALKISMRKLASQEDLSGVDGKLGEYPVGNHWTKIVMTNGTLQSKFHLLDEAQSDSAKADTAMGHISDTLDMVKTVKK